MLYNTVSFLHISTFTVSITAIKASAVRIDKISGAFAIPTTEQNNISYVALLEQLMDPEPESVPGLLIVMEILSIISGGKSVLSVPHLAANLRGLS